MRWDEVWAKDQAWGCPCHPKKYPRRTSVKAWGCPEAPLLHWQKSGYWYVSNISIIFDAPCLFLHHLHWVLLHFLAFDAFSGTNLLTRCHSASSLFFCYFCVSEKFHRKYSRNWTKQEPNLLFLPKLCEDRRWDGGGQGPASPPGVWPSPWSRAPVVRPPGPTSDDALSPIKSPRREKPKG
jgi:hypothetical protein